MKMETTLRHADVDTLRRLALAAECRDHYTGVHMVRTGVLSAFLGAKLGLQKDTVYGLRHAAPMHDLGKIGIPDSILCNPGRLTPEEFEVMKSHTTLGARILESSQNIILDVAREIALSHHERWDGRGYPGGLAGEQIPLMGRIVGLIDAFDAMTSTRAYRDAKSADEACQIIDNQRGLQFDPGLVEVFFDNLDHILHIRSKLGASRCVVKAPCTSEACDRGCRKRTHRRGVLRLIKSS